MTFLRSKRNARDKNVYGNENAFDGLLRRLDVAEERISELEDISVETSKTEKQREKRPKTGTKRPRTVKQLQKV